MLVARRGPAEKLAGFWEFPGGKLELDETLEDCLKRELLEELGVEVKVGLKVAETNYAYEHGSIRLVAFDVEWLSGKFNLKVHDEIRWTLPELLVNLKLAPADIPIAEHLAKR